MTTGAEEAPANTDKRGARAAQDEARPEAGGYGASPVEGENQLQGASRSAKREVAARKAVLARGAGKGSALLATRSEEEKGRAPRRSAKR